MNLDGILHHVSRRGVDRIYSVILLCIVVLSWAFVIYGSRVAAQWLLDERTSKS